MQILIKNKTDHLDGLTATIRVLSPVDVPPLDTNIH